ncbi:hypothetical protein [Amycolatopsis sp. SID8362]|nr:hypothetical protein [Amycolatopsis sp. SID8362]NBH01951.1 hypothetical protein [Amycolatopsis sp. SID8362]NED38654.1 hypothetical protein [Amycolatopsis sp. SID8362]
MNPSEPVVTEHRYQLADGTVLVERVTITPISFDVPDDLSGLDTTEENDR